MFCEREREEVRRNSEVYRFIANVRFLREIFFNIENYSPFKCACSDRNFARNLYEGGNMIWQLLSRRATV
jgi:hypothetical protein